MSERSEYAPGEFCWVDLATSDTNAAAKLYGELLGWEAESAGPVEETGGYGFFTRNGKQVAGYGPLQREGQPTTWSSYVKVVDADETAEKVNGAGGSVFMEPFDLPADSGRMAVIADPSGAVVCIVQQKQHHGAELVNEVGSWTWNQLATPDLDAARDFYGKVFDWSLEHAAEAPPESPYWMWQVEGQRWEEGIAGAMVMGPETPAGTPPHWMVYFAVENADAAVETVERHGGALLFGPQAIPVGRLALFTDPQGAAFGVIQPDYPEAR
jgi:predicted enzyme related to lactoylglutathione lyase